MHKLPITLVICYAVLAVLGIGAAWDLSLSLFCHVPTWCDFLRRWNTTSNDLLAMEMLAAIGYLGCAWAWGPTVPAIVNRRDNRVLFCAWAFAGLWAHLFLLQLLHGWGIQSRLQ